MDWKKLTWWILGLGAVLRLRQAYSGRSLWLDEAALAMNLVDRSFWQLFEPLQFDQAAPVGFLFLEWLSLQTLGRTAFALRLAPLLAALGSLVLMHLLARRLMDAAFTWVALALFALMEVFLYFSCEAKPYSIDIFLTMLLLYLALRPGQSLKLLTIVGCAAAWFSFVMVFVLAAVDLVGCMESLQKKEGSRLKAWLWVGIFWLASLLPFLWLSMQSSPKTPYLMAFWKSAFWPVPPDSWREFLWPLEIYFRFFTILLGLPSVAAGVAIVLTPVGLFSFYKREPKAASLLALPFILALLASAVRAYPFFGRPVLFLMPLLLLFCAEGLAWTGKRYGKNWFVGLLVAMLLAYPVWIGLYRLYRPIQWEELHPVLEQVRQKSAAQDKFYVYFESRHAFRFYQPHLGFDPVEFWPNPRAYHPDLALLAFEGLCGQGRVWLIFSHVFAEDQALAELYLFPLGHELDRIEAYGAFAILMDF